MEKETSSKAAAKQKLMPQVLKILEAQGGQSLGQARKRLVEIKVENATARKGLKMYAKNWNDVIHPSILSLSFDAVSETPAAAVTDLQVMVLLITAAMDIHDDVLDKSLTKNGKETLYGKFGEDLAILIGDALLMESLMMLPSLRNLMDLESFDRMVLAVKNALLQVGNAHLIELQLKKKTKVVPEDILGLIEKKAAIFEGIAEIGAIAGKGAKEQISVLKAAAKSFGYLVMLREEFIDMFEPDELSSRLENEYLPLPVLYALEDLKIKQYVINLRNRKITDKAVQELIDLVYENPSVVKLKKNMRDRANESIGSLESLHLRKKPVMSLASLINVTLEDL